MERVAKIGVVVVSDYNATNKTIKATIIEMNCFDASDSATAS
jgi:ABC-type metal ion transport system substrate-binding protein